MTVVECGLKVWIGRPLKGEPILASENVEKLFGEDGTVLVQAEVKYCVKGLTYFIGWQQTKDYGPRGATCSINTSTPKGPMTERGRVKMESGQESLVYSFGRTKEDFLIISSCHTLDESLKKYNNVTGYARLQVDFFQQTGIPETMAAALSKLYRVIFTFVFTYEEEVYKFDWLRRPSSSSSHHTDYAHSPAKRTRRDTGSSDRDQIQSSSQRDSIQPPHNTRGRPRRKLRTIVCNTEGEHYDISGGTAQTGLMQGGIDIPHTERFGQQRALSPIELSDSEEEDDEPAASLAEEQRKVDQAAAELKQAERDRQQAMVKRRKLLEEQARVLKKGTQKMLDENDRMKGTFNG